MDFGTTLAHKFRTRLQIKQHDAILLKEQSVVTKIMSSFEGENMQTQYNVLSYRIDFYFHDYKLAIEIDENGHSDGSIDYEIKRYSHTVNLLGLIILKKTLMFLELAMKYLDTLSNQLRKF